MTSSSTSAFMRFLGTAVLFAAVVATAESFALLETISGQESCSAEQFQCISSKECILKEWRCDGDPDCSDRSDEHNCAAPCTDEQFLCDNGFCVGRRYRCDGGRDCTDGSDEADCTDAKGCSQKQFACDDGRCVPYCWECDGYHDCMDGSDEDPVKCKNRTNGCGVHVIACTLQKGDVKFLPITWLCDGEKDCPDGSDEGDCEKEACTANQFACQNGDCIVRKWRCDADDDCTDGSDERDCESATCTGTEFRCKSGQCIPDEHLCDGDRDCSDASDEDTTICLKGPTGCLPKQFACNPQNGSVMCLPMRFHCDEEKDCPDGSDEDGCDAPRTIFL
ncbi:uncharacterized protein LOC144158784 [Haemaphysalis longicornis]